VPDLRALPRKFPLNYLVAKTIQKTPEAPAAVPEETFGQQVARTLAEIRAGKIRDMRARNPQPSYDAIAREMGVCVKTVSNILTKRTHAGD
jgi:hypothetical protein